MSKGQWDIVKAEFVTSTVRQDQHPHPVLPEIAFMGRSNVGKSSLINSLCRRNSLARVSGSPGKTQTINFYHLTAKKTEDKEELRAGFYLVDLPGYGFARTNKENRQQWSGFIRKYLEDSPNIALVCQLMDIRHDLMASDLDAYKWMLSCGLDVMVILTKMDKISKNTAASQLKTFREKLAIAPERIMSYSVPQPSMRSDLIGRIMEKLLEGAVEEEA